MDCSGTGVDQVFHVNTDSLITNFLFSSRSQAASTMSKNGQLLHIIGGRSHFQSSLESMQSVGLQEPSREKQMMVNQRLHSSRFASVVTLSTGDLVITGGKTNQHGAFLISQFNLTNWSRLPQMKYGRFAHSSCSLIQDSVCAQTQGKPCDSELPRPCGALNHPDMS